jgi:NADP-dependent 3-hydroxy acid dehydrogenase YdfG
MDISGKTAIVTGAASGIGPGTATSSLTRRSTCRSGPRSQRIKRVAQLGFEEILIGSQFGAIEEIERVRDFLKT